MSSNDAREGIQFTWRIENFSYRRNKELRSPSFGSNYPVWAIQITDDNNYISATFENATLEKDNIKCSLALLDSDGIPLIWRETKHLKYSFTHFNDFIALKKLNSNKAKFLPNDTLIIQCRMWTTPRGLTAPVLRFARTRIEPTVKVIKKIFTWDIVDASSLQPLRSLRRREVISNGQSVWFELNLNENDEFILRCGSSLFNIQVNVKIDVLGASGKRIEFANGKEGCLGKYESFVLFTDVTKTMLMCYPNEFLPANTLSLQFICTFSGYVLFNCMVDASEILADVPSTSTTFYESSETSACVDEPETNQPTEPLPPNTITKALQDMFEEGFLSDFNLRVGERLFPVHRSILGMRSQVFRAMFTTEMKEKEDNCVDIKDVDEETLQRMLQFLYSDRIEEDMGWERASSLYAAADKYALEPLKQGCSAILKSGLCISSVLDVLLLADMHQDEDLKSTALDFISLNDQDIVGTEIWIGFEEENAKLALETCRKLYLKKMKG